MMVMDGQPVTCAAIRVFGSALTLFAVMFFTGKPLTAPLDKTFYWSGLTQVAANTALCSLALIYGGVGKAVILVFTMPFWAMMISRIFFHEKIALPNRIALVIALCGIAVIASQSFGNFGQFTAGLCAIGAGLAWAIGTTIVRRAKPQDMLLRVAWEQLISVIPLVLLAILMEERVPALTAQFLLATAYSTFIGTGLGWILWNRTAASVSPGIVSIGSFAIPVIASLSGFFQLGELPDVVTLIGLATIVVALLVASLGGMWLRQRAAARLGNRDVPTI